MNLFQQLALIGPTASGKSALGIAYAQKHNCNILSLDSLAIYKEIDIVSAKPTPQERQEIKHFGIDLIYPDECFDVTTFIECYQEAKERSILEQKGLVIVGGTSFYLKMLIEGISPLPTISEETKEQTRATLDKGYTILSDIDPTYMQQIKPNDRYRIEKMLNLYYETGLIPTEYFKQHPPIPTIQEPLPIYEIAIDREILRSRIRQRTEKMILQGLIDEIFYLEKSYTRSPNAMRAIGIRETLEYFDGIYTKEELKEKIIINTARLAKRQQTFNRSQFPQRTSLSLEELETLLLG
jgi:tRNA dimethylallyltransferase